jgi:hypothetical protein
MSLSRSAATKYLPVAEILTIAALACVPLFLSFPYRVNIFLSWEGAYRMSEGQLPFRDFGMPVGGMYWVIPAIFFKLFGPAMVSLVKAQVLINILSGLAFRSILKSCGVQPGIKFAAVLLYCLSFSFFNFWPWYNHSVIVYEFIALAFLLKAIARGKSRYTILWLMLSGLFICCSFLTKQDGGAMGFLIAMGLMVYYLVYGKNWAHFLIYIGSVVIFLLAFILPFTAYKFGYWFNHGQAPHSGRISSFELIDELLANSNWLKFYVFLILVLLIVNYRQWKELWKNKTDMLFLILTIGIIAEASIFQVTSYTPPDNNIFFHSFAIAFILSQFARISPLRFGNLKVIMACCAGILFWWSGVYWKYIQRFAERAFPPDTAVVGPHGENIVNRHTYMVFPVDTTDEPMSQWTFSPLNSFKKIYMPSATVDGISRIMQMDMVKQNKGDLRVLNMTELTPLAVEMPYKLETGSHYPLWYHLGVSMFNKQAEMFEKRIVAKEYDLVLFEYIPRLNNFYPFRIRDSLLTYYQKIDSFPAPRRGDTRGTIEVFIK